MVSGNIPGPWGILKIGATEKGVCKVALNEGDWAEYCRGKSGECMEETNLPQEKEYLAMAMRQLAEFFQGQRQSFDLPVVMEGTSFQQRVWEEICRIGFAQTCSYGELAVRIGNPGAVRAVGQACRRNHLPIIIPCHRVMGRQGKLTGYKGVHTEWKEMLLRLEKR